MYATCTSVEGIPVRLVHNYVILPVAFNCTANPVKNYSLKGVCVVDSKLHYSTLSYPVFESARVERVE